MILITGATGKTGQEIIKLMKARNIPARALVRDAGKAEKLRGMGVEVIEGDMADNNSVNRALAGIEKAFLLMANTENQGILEKQFIDAARIASVSHIVKMSATNADSQSSGTLKKIHGESEEHLRQSGMTFTIIQPNYFMQNIFHSAQSIISENRFYLPFGQSKVGAIDLRDVAEVSLAGLTDDRHQNKSYLITGPENLSFTDVAEVLTQVLGRKINYVDVPLKEFRSQLMNWGQSEWYVDAVMQNFQAIAQGSCEINTTTFEELTGKKARSMQEFVQDHVSVFN